jgi:excisionase family DNA binding protein
MGENRDTAQDKVTIQEAARRLGVDEDAIRKRIQRGRMRHEKAEHGRVYVWVDADQDATRDRHQDTAQAERLDDLQEQLGYLRRQLDEEREALRRAYTIIAQLARANEELTRTIRELEGRSELPPDERESPEGSGATAEGREIREELDTERARRETAETTLHEGMAEERRRREAAERERDELRRRMYGLREGRKSAQKADEQQGRGHAEPATVGARGPIRRPWWRRMLGD